MMELQISELEVEAFKIRSGRWSPGELFYRGVTY